MSSSYPSDYSYDIHKIVNHDTIFNNSKEPKVELYSVHSTISDSMQMQTKKKKKRPNANIYEKIKIINYSDKFDNSPINNTNSSMNGKFLPYEKRTSKFLTKSKTNTEGFKKEKQIEEDSQIEKSLLKCKNLHSFIREPFVRLLIEDTLLSLKDQYVVVNVKTPIKIRLPKLKFRIPLEKHGKIHHASSIITISAPREDKVKHIIECFSINTINMEKKYITLSQEQSITLIAYGQTWFTM
jgi:hypothetical protein